MANDDKVEFDSIIDGKTVANQQQHEHHHMDKRDSNSVLVATSIPILQLNVAGEWGPWQRRFFIFFMITAMCSSWHSLQLTFIGPKVKYECIDPFNHSSSNGSMISPITTSISTTPSSSSSSSSSDQCMIDGIACTKWSYDVGHNDSFYHRTIVSEWDLVCNQSWLVSFTQSMYMIGTLMAVFGMAHCSDHFGRRPTILIGWFFQLAGCLSCAFSTSIIQFLISRLILAFGMGTTWSTGFVLLIEMVGPEKREFAGLAVQLGWAFGYVTLPGVAYLARDFRILLICCAALQLLQLPLYWMVTESPRWLLTKRNINDSTKLLKRIGKMNKCHLSSSEIETMVVQANEHEIKHSQLMNSHAKTKRYTIFDLFRTCTMARTTLMIYFLWFCNSLIYYGLSLNTNDWNGDPFINFLLLGLVEFPAYIGCMYLVPLFGHRRALMVTLMGAGIGCLLSILTTYNTHMGIFFASMGKFCVTCSFAIIYVYSAQIYPTVIRTIGVGSSSTVARIGSILAPFIKDLSQATTLAVPMVMLGILSIVAASFVLFIHEPRGTEIPDRPEDLEKK